MKPFASILVDIDATDAHHPALERAARLARHCGARLTITDVMTIPSHARRYLPAGFVEEMVSRRRHGARPGSAAVEPRPPDPIARARCDDTVSTTVRGRGHGAAAAVSVSGLPRPAGHGGPASPDCGGRRCEHRARFREGALVQSFGGRLPGFQAIHLRGAPEDLIPAFAAEHRIDRLVMGTVARTGVAGFFIGNTAERVLRNLPCSVLAVKPDGLVSPVGPSAV